MYIEITTYQIKSAVEKRRLLLLMMRMKLSRQLNKRRILQSQKKDQ